jgi:hypothetical protein
MLIQRFIRVWKSDQARYYAIYFSPTKRIWALCRAGHDERSTRIAAKGAAERAARRATLGGSLGRGARASQGVVDFDVALPLALGVSGIHTGAELAVIGVSRGCGHQGFSLDSPSFLPREFRE